MWWRNLAEQPKMYVLTQGNEVITVICDKNFLKSVYPKLLDGWHIITSVTIEKVSEHIA